MAGKVTKYLVSNFLWRNTWISVAFGRVLPCAQIRLSSLLELQCIVAPALEKNDLKSCLKMFLFVQRMILLKILSLLSSPVIHLLSSLCRKLYPLSCSCRSSCPQRLQKSWNPSSNTFPTKLLFFSVFKPLLLVPY